jgi:hypothetical protein
VLPPTVFSFQPKIGNFECTGQNHVALKEAFLLAGPDPALLEMLRAVRDAARVSDGRSPLRGGSQQDQNQQIKKPGRRAGLSHLLVPPYFFARISFAREPVKHGGRGATKWQEGQFNGCCSQDTAGVEPRS